MDQSMLWENIEMHLSRIADALSTSSGGASDGFCDAIPGMRRRVHVNRSNGSLWYYMNDGNVEPIEAAAFRGKIVSLNVVETESDRYGTKWKIRLMMGNREFQIGRDTVTAKSLYACIIAAPEKQLRSPLYIAPKAGDGDNTLFLSFYDDNGLILLQPYAQIDLQQLENQALQKLYDLGLTVVVQSLEQRSAA